MSRVTKLVAAASELNKCEIRELKREIDRLEKRTRSIFVKSKKCSHRLVRLDDGEFIDLHRRSLAIEDFGFEFWYAVTRRDKEEELNLAEAFLALNELTGESGRHFDDWKGSFSFPFSFEIRRGQLSYPYLLEVRDFRGSLEFALRKVVAEDDPRLQEHLIHPPFVEELSKDDILYLFNYLYGYLIGYWEAAKSMPHAPFVRKVSSNIILFGYCDANAFEEHFNSPELFDEAFKRYQARVKGKRTFEIQADPCVMLEHKQESANTYQGDKQARGK